jgi:hypothetical protein
MKMLNRVMIPNKMKPNPAPVLPLYRWPRPGKMKERKKAKAGALTLMASDIKPPFYGFCFLELTTYRSKTIVSARNQLSVHT